MIDAGVEAVQAAAPVAQAVQVAAPVVQAVQQQQPAVTMVWWLLLALTLTVFFLVVFIRALPWSEKFKAQKPLVCDACVTGWLVIGLGVWLGYTTTPFFSVMHMLPAGGLALGLLALYGRIKVEDLKPPV